MERRCYAMRLWYEGGRFRGYQRQPGLPTVERALCEALERSGVAARPVAAARTDAGVHAMAQVVSFAVRRELDPVLLRREVNAALPEGVAVVEAWAAARNFHARASARSRTYVYLVGSELPEVLRGYAWALPDERAFPGVHPQHPDPSAMRLALALAVGTHDFRGFARPGPSAGGARTLLRAEVVSASWAPFHALLFEGTGFARAMVRNLCGTVVAVGLGLAPPARVSEIIASRGRYRGVRAPAWGLTLASVLYSPDEP
ncbi:MAG TPA: tRNA pseudouridine(38-40) synthase TruA [Anaeromyxobacter sp.]|nr:tRNA pseudouridine(38-40) synthase TruA [Anaeromyxobacter sp.]